MGQHSHLGGHGQSSSDFSHLEDVTWVAGRQRSHHEEDLPVAIRRHIPQLPRRQLQAILHGSVASAVQAQLLGPQELQVLHLAVRRPGQLGDDLGHAVPRAADRELRQGVGVKELAYEDL